VLHPALLSEIGAVTVLAGGLSAYRGYCKDQLTLQTTAGLLLIAGFACLGVAIQLIVVPPLL
jgi:hypothetical protein